MLLVHVCVCMYLYRGLEPTSDLALVGTAAHHMFAHTGRMSVTIVGIQT